MSLSQRRLSVTSVRSASPLAFVVAPNADAEEWTKSWHHVHAKDLIDSPVVAVEADLTVEDACERLLSEDLPCLAVYRRPGDIHHHNTPFHGLFDYSDVNAFLTLAATRHRWSPEDLKERPRIEEIINAAIADRVSVYLVSNLSEKNPLEVLPHDATVLSLLSVFARGSHRALIRAASPSTEFLGIVSDRSLLSWFADHSQTTTTFLSYLSNTLSSLNLPSLYLYTAIVAAKASDSVLDGMKLMSDQGVSSVAVIEEENGSLLSAISVTDIGKIVVPSQSNQILSTPLHVFIKRIKEPDGSTDGVDKYPGTNLPLYPPQRPTHHMHLSQYTVFYQQVPYFTRCRS
ncbi:hypothetical protein NLI96_g12512 [Meripilus lineatus]|uniref:CBS domain-containing protein n=1 Tax=Meripilus lineatus TaxID=2056292 RepID=A0AAD5UPQ7_9APHY|nr:hypothetical protein NLI96_g12512 [Physisporinus lineatus]